MKRLLFLFSFVAFSTASQAQTEEVAELVEWIFSPLMREGNLVGCSFEFNAVVAPSQVANGGALGIAGSVGLELSKRLLGGYLKGGVLSFSSASPSGTAVPIQTFHLSVDGKPIQLLETYDSDRKGFKFSVLRPEKAAEALAWLLKAQSVRWTFKLPDKFYDQIVRAGQLIPDPIKLQAAECVTSLSGQLREERAIR